MASNYNTPPRGAKLQYGHPLGAGLTAAWIFNDRGQTQPPSTQVPVVVRDKAYRNPNYNLVIAGPSTHFTRASGPNGYCLDRDSNTASEFLKLASGSVATGTTFTLAARVMLRSVNAGAGGYAAIAVVAGGNGAYIKLTAATYNFIWYSGAVKTSAKALNLNQWYDVAYVCSGGNLSFYIDGILDANTYSSIASAALDSFMHDRGAAGAGAVFDGQIAYIHLWAGRALKAQDVQSLKGDPFSMFRPRQIMPPTAAFVPWGNMADYGEIHTEPLTKVLAY